MNELLQKTGAVLFSGGQIDRDTALALAGAGEALYRLADEVCRRFMGNCFDLCAIINAKNNNYSLSSVWFSPAFASISV